ncbi:MAG: glucokinase, partial [Methylococcaceae bacterium]|nr:glucokinase [Methylococcaceae bacterium]
MILAGDVGGTKTILALYARRQGVITCVKKQQYASQQYASFEEVLTAFLADTASGTIEAACIGIAGPIVEGDCHATNLPWQLIKATIAEQLQTQRLSLLNDLEATAWGVLGLPLSDFVELNTHAEQRSGHVAILAAGTGLGESLCCWDGQRYQVMPSEGGHVDFAPTSEQEIDLLRFLMRQYSGHVSYERVVSGMGLVNIYQFLKHSGFAIEHPEIAEKMAQNDPGAVIGAAGIANTDALCVETLRLFCRLYGAQAGNLALTCLPYGGVFLAGGIAAKILPFITQGDFIQGFLDKGRYQPLLAKLSVKICTNPEVALI